MKVMAVAVGVALSLGAATGRPAFAQTPDAATVLAAARHALGGESRLSAVTSIQLDGLWWPNPHDCYGPRQVIFEAPGRFIERNARRNDAPYDCENSQIPEIPVRRGFVGDVPIHESLGVPNVLDEKHRSVRYLLPLFASSFGSYPLSFSLVGRQKVAGKVADVIVARGPDGFEFRLFVDLKTHLPILLTWSSAAPRLRIDRATGTLTTEPGEVVEYRMSIGDYKRINGLNWPRRFRVQVNTNVVDEFWRVRFTINPAIDPNLLRVTKDIVVTLSTPQMTAVSGHVAVAAGAPRMSYFVVVFPSDRSLWIPQSRLVRSQQPDAAGLCQFQDLPRGEYQVAVVTDVPPDQIDAGYLAALMPDSLAFIVRARQTTFQLRIPPGLRPLHSAGAGLWPRALGNGGPPPPGEAELRRATPSPAEARPQVRWKNRWPRAQSGARRWD